ncbi:MAG: transporter substrate-binding domain-containing protein [Desulfamplus sp.]|nr:transporter substrate-binding domain-containing protein [Desulfamplus sp.]
MKQQKLNELSVAFFYFIHSIKGHSNSEFLRQFNLKRLHSIDFSAAFMHSAGLKQRYLKVLLLILSIIVSTGMFTKEFLAYGAESDITAALTDHEKAWLEAHPVIRLAPDPEFKPIEFFDQNGNYSGIAADYARLIGEKLGIRFQIVRTANWNDVIERVKRREVDVLGNAVKTPQREQYLQFPEPYLKIPSVIIIRNSVKGNITLDMLKGMDIVMVSGYGYVDIIRNKYPELNFDLVPELKTALRKVSFGMADAFVGDLATASFYLESEGITNLRLGGETEPPNISGFAVRSDWPELGTILEKGIAMLTEQEKKEIYNRWIHLASEPGLSKKEVTNLMLIVAGVVSLLIAGFLLWNRMLKRMVNTKTEELRKEIEERKRAEDSLAKNEAHLRTLLKTIPDLVWLKDPNGVYIACNARFERLVAMKDKDIFGKTDYDFNDKQKADFYRKNDQLAIEQGHHMLSEEVLTYADDGHTEIVETIKTAVYGSSGELIGVLGISHDITGRKQAEEEKQKLQDQLFHARKMDAVGRLAGGVAHDFNNMLSIIIGRAELARMKLKPSDLLYNDLCEIESVGKRSADLTRQLLAFASKQTIAPQILDLNDTIESMLKMLRRLIGEDIDLVWSPDPTLWPVKMDPAQIDQLLANLLINARDSINVRGAEGVWNSTYDKSGKVTIETGNIVFDTEYCQRHPDFLPGEYALLAVSDNGCGMDKDTLKNIFEPFFTTKEFGQGTGLGLSTIYGIVKQNQGFIHVYSEPEKGSSFKIYLPRSGARTDWSTARSFEDGMTGGDQTVLLVEDEPAILEVTELMLQRLGYKVITADRPNEALLLANEHKGQIDLLITDVIMPEMNGRDLAQKMLAIYPHINLLFMSGYTANVIAHHGILDQDIHFIQKPFSMQDLALKVRESLKQG